MRHINQYPELKHLFDRVLFHARGMGRTLPEMRFFVLDPLEFASLLEKNVYPVSPINIWEGRNMVHKKHRIRTGQESALYYEVVQPGNPSYAYLNETNSPMVQASVMAHVVGHCEFSELNVLKDSNPDRTEYVMYLVRKVNRSRLQMGDINYQQYWNACESAVPLIAPNSQFNLEGAIVDESGSAKEMSEEQNGTDSKPYQVYSTTMEHLFHSENVESAFKNELKKKIRKETLSRKGYKLKAPCQDIMGFLTAYAPSSQAEKSILDYHYTIHAHQDFIMRTQIMNEGWAMYWEKQIMLELFKEKAVKGIIDYSRIFSGVCYPRPFFSRNPYHLGYHLWCHIKELYQEGKVSLEYFEETDQNKRDNWKQPSDRDPLKGMEELVRTITDYEFLRRFLTPKLIEQFLLSRLDKRYVRSLGIRQEDIVKEDTQWVWLDPQKVKEEMLMYFSHFNRPRIYLIDNDFLDGGLLLYHRYEGRHLKANWIEPTLKNINMIWKGPVYLATEKSLYQYASRRFQRSDISPIEFDQVLERMRMDEKPVKLM